VKVDDSHRKRIGRQNTSRSVRINGHILIMTSSLSATGQSTHKLTNRKAGIEKARNNHPLRIQQYLECSEAV
jgi:hypothetical protein